MNRKEFLKQLWKQVFKPLLVLIAIYCCVKIFISIYESNWTMSTILAGIIFIGEVLLGIAALVGIALGINIVLGAIINRLNNVYQKLSPELQTKIKIFFRMLGFAFPMAMGAVAYYCWQKDKWIVIGALVYLFVSQFSRMVKEEKQKNLKA